MDAKTAHFLFKDNNMLKEFPIFMKKLSVAWDAGSNVFFLFLPSTWVVATDKKLD